MRGTPIEYFMALRFLRDGRMQSVLIIAGVGVGVAVIVFLSALIAGLQDNLIRQTLGSQAHIVVRPLEPTPRPVLPREAERTILSRLDRAPQRPRQLDGWERTLEAILREPGVTAAAPIAAGPAFAARGTATRSVLIRGTELSRLQAIIPIGERLVEGVAALSGDDAIIGIRLAEELGLSPGDTLRLTTGETETGVFTVRGVFDLGNKEVNARWVLLPLRAAQSLLGLGAGVSDIDIAVRAVFDADAIASRIEARTGLVADSWMTLNAQLLTGLRSQSASSLMIQVFIILAVAMGIASVLVVSVIQRSREIGILRAMGIPRARVLRVFLIQGLIVGLGGAAIGLALGGGLALFFEGLAANADGSPTFPITLDPALILSAIGVAVATGLVAAVVPARRAARLDPAAAIRND